MKGHCLQMRHHQDSHANEQQIYTLPNLKDENLDDAASAINDYIYTPTSPTSPFKQGEFFSHFASTFVDLNLNGNHCGIGLLQSKLV
ncbi:hypothetical protein LOK49_LG07G01002 [Camellia lanceoleosa]|uniref:Uncharacterized protein n=1 Tax=Camellia lanceoleosa TaxID=1840588 RepID=A0ACC0H6G0_9ERIC|nr:hypothetical protein LOK49_LG07G01002 [Camellia lanceoleosa]